MSGVDPGESKKKDAEKHKIPEIDEDGLFALIANAPVVGYKKGGGSAKKPAPAAKSKPAASSASTTSSTSATPSTPSPRPVTTAPSSASSSSSSSSRHTLNVASSSGGSHARQKTGLWVDDWEPLSSTDMVGHTTVAHQIRVFLLNFVKHTHAAQFDQALSSLRSASNSKDRDEMIRQLTTKKAILLSGGPGIGAVLILSLSLLCVC